jgi:hypothetical protein
MKLKGEGGRRSGNKLIFFPTLSFRVKKRPPGAVYEYINLGSYC